MPYFMVKITTRDGDIRQPIVANSKDESDACELVKYLCDSGDKIEAKALRLNQEEVKKNFGEIKLNHGAVCWNWAWADDGASDEIEILPDWRH